jgi:hypothetical protein
MPMAEELPRDTAEVSVPARKIEATKMATCRRPMPMVAAETSRQLPNLFDLTM